MGTGFIETAQAPAHCRWQEPMLRGRIWSDAFDQLEIRLSNGSNVDINALVGSAAADSRDYGTYDCRGSWV